MIKALIPAFALWAGAAGAEDVSFLNDRLTLSIPSDMRVARAFGADTQDGVYAVELGSISIEELWTQDGRDTELADMDRMEAAFGLTFPSAICADYAQNTPVVPTRCKQAIEMSVIVVPKDWPDAGARLGNQLGMLGADVETAWAEGDLDALLTSFCANDQHPHRKEVARTADHITCISDRPALAPHFLSFRLILTADYATIMYGQNIAAETDVIMTYGVDNFLTLLEGARDIEATLLGATESYIADHDVDQLYLTPKFDAVTLTP